MLYTLQVIESQSLYYDIEASSAAEAKRLYDERDGHLEPDDEEAMGTELLAIRNPSGEEEDY